MTISDLMMIVALVAGPILAVQTQKLIERWNQQRERKDWVFKTLMATRATPLSPLHVQALNMIDLEFSRRRQGERVVLDAWKVYLDHLCDAPRDLQDASYQARFSVWLSGTNDRLMELLFAMSRSLGYNFDKVQLKKGAYNPQHYANLELEQSLIRKGELELLYHQRTLRVEVIEQQAGG